MREILESELETGYRTLALRTRRAGEFRGNIDGSARHLDGSFPVGIPGFAKTDRMTASWHGHGGRRGADKVAVDLDFGAAGS